MQRLNLNHWQIVLFSAITFLAVANCSFTDGQPWGEVEGSIAAQPVDSTGAIPEDVTLEQATIDAKLFVESVSTSSGGSGGSFSPSNPPDGYTLCHNGHCHSEEGELVSYEDVRAELNSKAGTSTTTLGRWEGDVDLQTGEMTRLPAIKIAQRTSIDRVKMRATNVILTGTIQTGGETVPIEAQLGQFDIATLEGIGMQVGPNAPFRQSIRLCAQWGNDWFDDIDFSQLDRQDGTVRLTRILNDTATQKLIDAVQNAQLARSNCN